MIQISLNGKVALVTGAGGGIGGATALKLAEAGAEVMLADMNLELAEQKAKSIQEKTGKECAAVAVNVVLEDEVIAMVDATVERFGKIDIMVNCAGIAMRKPYDQFTKKDIDSIFDINVKGVLYGCRAAAKKMLAQKSGAIINFSSIAARMGQAELGLYGASKVGVIALTQSFGREFASSNVRVNAVLPGHVRTPMWEKELNVMTGNGTEEEKAKRFAKVIHDEGIPMGHPQTPEDIANAVLFLASDLAANITAQSLSIDGGTTIAF